MCVKILVTMTHEQTAGSGVLSQDCKQVDFHKILDAHYQEPSHFSSQTLSSCSLLAVKKRNFLLYNMTSDLLLCIDTLYFISYPKKFKKENIAQPNKIMKQTKTNKLKKYQTGKNRGGEVHNFESHSDPNSVYRYNHNECHKH